VQSSFTRADGGGLRSAANFFLHSSARAAFRERWPLAFPTKHEDVRPLAMASPAKSPRRWGGRFPIRSASSRDGKWRRSTQAVLSHDQRIGLDGSPAELVDAEAKELATKQMAQLEARKAAKKAAEIASAAVGKPKPRPTRPTETPEQLRDRVRAGLLRFRSLCRIADAPRETRR
jgi:hypothetical protein